MPATNSPVVIDTIDELNSLVLTLRMSSDPEATRLADELQNVIARNLAGAGDVVTVEGSVVTVTPAPVQQDDDDADYDADYDEPNRLVATYRRHGADAEPLTEDELQLVLADAQPALELAGIGRLAVTRTEADEADPVATVVYYEVIEPGATPLSAIPVGVGVGIVGGVGRIEVKTATTFVE